jgi:hypothetical protein
MQKTRPLRQMIGAGLIAAAMAPQVLLASNAWNGYHWGRTSNPFAVRVGNNLTTGAWQDAYMRAIGDWSRSTALDLLAATGQSRNTSRCAPVSGRIEVCNDFYGNTGWLGVAQVWTSGTHITQAVVKLNDTYYSAPRYNRPEWRNMVMCQEVGHALGLDHQDENTTNGNLGTCMDYTDYPLGPLNNERPNQHDYDELYGIYQHSDSAGSATTSMMAPNLPAAEAGNNRAEWGELIAVNKGGRTERFVLQLGGGHQLTTFVIRADPVSQPGAIDPLR